MSKEARNPNNEVNLWGKRDAHIYVSFFVIRHSGIRDSLSFRFFDNVPQIGWIGAAAHLASEDRRRICRDDLVTLQHELWINPIARRLIHFIAAKITVELVFVVVIAADLQTLAVGRKFFFLVEHYHLR